MGTIIHNAIVITCDTEKVMDVLMLVKEIMGSDLVAGPILSRANMYATIFVGTDGSKLGWATHEKANEQRSQLIKSLESQSYFIEYVHVQYGECVPTILESD